METKNQDRISELVEKQKDTYTSMADEVWGYAEPRFQEYESSRVQQEYLASRGFSIRADLAGEKTAFIAEWGSGKPSLRLHCCSTPSPEVTGSICRVP